MIPTVPSMLSVFDLNEATLDSPAKGFSSMFITAADDGYSGVLREFAACSSDERSDSNVFHADRIWFRCSPSGISPSLHFRLFVCL